MSLIVEAAQKSLLSYSSLTNRNYLAPKHLVTIAKLLESVERGENKRVIITIPPRHGKSLLCSTYFPAWYLGKNPNKKIITATYGQDLSDDFGRKIRDQLQSPEFNAVFPDCKLDKRSQAANRLETTAGGTYFGVGVGSAITGRGADLCLVDDPIKNREEADSELMREKIWDWYRSVLYTRLMPGGALVIIMTRWNEDDLVGRIISQHQHENWKVVNLAAIDKEGVPLWPEAYDLSTLINISASVGEYDWQCLYQQNPIPASGIIVKPEWMKKGFQEDGYSAIMIGVDPAVGLKDQNDETAICVGGLGFGDVPKIDEIETVYGHWTMEEIMNMIETLFKKHKANLVGIENVAAQEWLVQQCIKRGINAVPVPTHGKDKVARFMGVSHFMTQGRVNLNTQKLREQGLRFRGKTEKNDLWDAFVIMMILIRDYTIERNKPTGISSEQARFIKDGVPMSSHDAWRIQTREHRQKQLNNPFGDMEEFNKTNFQVSEDFY